MAILILAAIGIDRAVATRIFAQPNTFVPAYRSFTSYEEGIKLQQFRSEENQRFTGFFIGNSRTMFGVNPAGFDSALGRLGIHFHSYNLAEESVDVQFWQPFFTRYYDRPPPRYVFLGLLPRDLDVGYTAEGQKFMDTFFGSPGYQNRKLSSLNRSAEEALARLYILHGRASDIHLLSFSDVVHDRKLSLDQGSLLNDQGAMAAPPSSQLSLGTLRSQAAAFAHRRGTQRFVLGPDQEHALSALNSWVRRGHGCLILFTTPLLYDDEQWGTELMRRGFTRAVQQLTQRIPGLQFVDVGARAQRHYGAQDYTNGDHLNQRGSLVFSAQLAGALRQAMDATACRG